MEKIMIFPSVPVVHVPITLYNSNKQAIDPKHILECNWYIDDQLVQSLKDDIVTSVATIKRSSTTSLSSLMTSGDQPPIFTYIPKFKDTNKVLKVSCKFKSKVLGLFPDTSSFTFEHKVLTSKSNLYRETFNIPNSSTSDNNNNLGAYTYRVIQYNILADCYTNKFIFPYCESYAIYYQYYRKYLIGKQILQYQPDIVGLQEVEESYVDLFKEMEEEGYMRSPPFPTNSSIVLSPGISAEGCVIFYKQSKFKLISHLLIRYQSITKENSVSQNPNSLINQQQYQFLLTEPLFKNILEKYLTTTDHHTKHVILLLEDKQTQKQFVCASLHLFWGSIANMEFNYQFQCMQVVIFSMILENFLKQNNLPLDTGIIICGDFNSGPDSETYSLTSNGSFCNENTKFTIPFKSQFNFKSIYSNLPNGEPRFTNYTKSFIGNIDQIWVNNQFIAHSILDIGDRTLYNEFGYLPSIVLGSDHILLMTDVELKSKESNYTS